MKIENFSGWDFGFDEALDADQRVEIKKELEGLMTDFLIEKLSLTQADKIADYVGTAILKEAWDTVDVIPIRKGILVGMFHGEYGDDILMSIDDILKYDGLTDEDIALAKAAWNAFIDVLVEAQRKAGIID